jgi:hypothetical protein
MMKREVRNEISELLKEPLGLRYRMLIPEKNNISWRLDEDGTLWK